MLLKMTDSCNNCVLKLIDTYKPKKLKSTSRPDRIACGETNLPTNLQDLFWISI